MRRFVLSTLVAAAVLAGCRESGNTAVPKIATTADSADQVFYKLRTLLTDRGVMRAELLADTGYAFDENTRYELRVVATTFFSSDGAKNGTLTARRGMYNTRANVMEARENVVITGVDGKRLTSPMVRFEQFRNLIVSDSPFVLLEGERRLEGIGFESDPQMLNVKVRQLSRATGASIILPSTKGSGPEFRNDPPPSSGAPTARPPVTPTAPPLKVKQ
jgi:LPS export ABC transporter protein LptC